MTDLGTETAQTTHQDAKAQAKAAKAYAKATRPWFKKKRFIVPIAGLVIFAVAQGTSESGTSTPASTDTTNTGESGGTQSDETATAGLNDSVRDGKFEFTVKKVDCGDTKVGPAGFNVRAQGQFCMVSVKVENIGDEAQTMFGDNQLLFDAEGREFSADTEAAIYMSEKAQTLWEEINPGNAVNGVVVFDVPKNAKPATLELHDSMFSDGVEVSLK